MSILAITVYTGNEKLVTMTESMLEQFAECCELTDEDVRVVAVNNGADRPIRRGLAAWNCHLDENQGFGRPVNLIINKELEPSDTHVLVMNNDLQFRQREWLRELLKVKHNKLVSSPCTDRTASPDAQALAATDDAPTRSAQVSAFCWLVPRWVIKSLKRRFRFPLFDPDFFAYGEDDFTSAILRRHVSPKPFLVVHRSWVKHLKHQTGKQTGHSGGMPKNVALLKAKMRRHGLR